MQNLREQLILKLKNLSFKEDGKIANEDIEAIISTINECIKASDNDIYAGIKGIGDRIQQTKQDIRPEAKPGVVQEATVELSEVVKSTEDATNKILDCADRIRAVISGVADKKIQDDVFKEISSVMEACSFQDLTGQRIKKVTSTLQYVEETVGSLLNCMSVNKKISKDVRADANLMSGPQLQSNTPSQDDVDNLFKNA